MSEDLPAGAGGVDREADDWFEQEMRDVAYAHEVLHDHDDDTGQPIMVCVECDEASPDVPDWQCRRLRFLAEVRSTRAALAAAEQRADTLAAAIHAVTDLCDEWERKAGPASSAAKVYGEQIMTVQFALSQIRAALSSRPVQPEGKQT